MSENPRKFFLTTPIYYVNARPHIGHAYTTIVADVLARRHRLLGDDTFFLTGTDEHGQKIERSAAAAGVPPQEFADEVSASFRTLWDRMGLTYDRYIRTTDPEHKRGVQKLFAALQAAGAIYKDTYTGQYCVSDESFVDVSPGAPCPDCGRITETISETNYYFRLSQYQQPLLDLIESNQLLIQPEARRNEVLSFLRGGLNDLSISRTSFKWGIPVPGDEEHVIYVWLDALANYMTALGYGSDAPEDIARFEKYWPADLHIVGKEIIRFHCVYWPAFLLAADIELPKQVVAHGWLLFEESKMSKSRGNIVRTETILDAFGPLCPLSPPELSFRSEAEESAGADATAIQRKHHQDLFAADVLRYFLLREIPFGQDGSFSFDALITRYNADLANGYGNLVSRVLTMVNQYYQGILPTAPRTQPINKTIFPDWWSTDPFTTEANFPDSSLDLPSTRIIAIRDMNKRVGMALSADLQVTGGHYFYSNTARLSLREFLQVAVDPLIRSTPRVEDSFDFARFCQGVAQHVRVVDEFLTLSRPWKMEQDDEKRGEVLNAAAEYIRIITALLYPILPYATASVWRQLGLGDIEQAARSGELNNLQWGGLKPGTRLGPLAPIFPRADKGLAQIMSDMEAPKAEAPIECVTGPNDPPAAQLGAVNPQHDAASPAQTDLGAAPIASQAATEPASHDPSAPPRTASLAEPNPGAQVAGSAAQTTERPGTPSHTEATASGIFSGAPADASPQITIDDFAKVELRVAQILVAERIPKADKLLRLEVDLGYEKRQILSGIAEWYTPEELVGRRIVVITNLAPRKMRGLESHGMLLAASTEGGKPHLATFGADADSLPLGSRLK